jgi:hypothetical protein
MPVLKERKTSPFQTWGIAHCVSLCKDGLGPNPEHKEKKSSQLSTHRGHLAPDVPTRDACREASALLSVMLP